MLPANAAAGFFQHLHAGRCVGGLGSEAPERYQGRHRRVEGAARLSGQARLLPKPPEQVLVAAVGGFLVGAGAALATGCIIGNILSGWALMSLGMVAFAMVTVLANWATTVLYLRGVH